jgi:hypothetical protein
MQKIILDNIKKELTDFVSVRFADKLIYFGGIGSQHQKADLLDDKIIDLDLVYIFRELGDETLSIFEEFLRQLTKKYTDDTQDVKYIIIHGPIKIDSNKENVIVIHNLIFDAVSFKSLVPLMKFSVQNTAERYWGSDEILREDKILLTKEMVLDSPLGILDCIKMIEGKVAFQFIWDADKKTFLPRPLELTNEIYFETICYGVIRSAVNVINLKTGSAYGSLKEAGLSARGVLPGGDFIDKISRLKDGFRRKELPIKDIDVVALAHDAVAYLSSLVESIH